MAESLSLYHRAVAARVGAAPHPLLLLLHGRGSHELDLLGLAPEVDPRFFVVSARAPYDWQDGYAWYETGGPGRPDLGTFARSLALLRSFVDELAGAYPIDPFLCYPLGFSQGAMMANALTLTAPEAVAGAVLLSGFQPPLDTLVLQADGVRDKPVFAAHGLYDPVLDVAMGRGVRDTLTALGADLTYREYPMGHQVTGEELAEIKAWLTGQLDARLSPS